MVAKGFKLYLYLELTVSLVSDCCPLGRLISFLMCTKIIVFFFVKKFVKLYLLDTVFIRFGTKLYRQIKGIQMGTNCAPLPADLFLFCYERDFIMEV